MGTRLKQQAPTLLALFILFISQFIFFYLELSFRTNDLQFAAAELVFFFVLYALSILRMPFVSQVIWTVLGCAALGVLRGYCFEFVTKHTMIFLAHLPICIFLLAQTRHTKRTVKKGGSLLPIFYPTLFLGFLIYGAIAFQNDLRKTIVETARYGWFIFLALIALYGLFMFVPASKKKGGKASPTQAQGNFLFAIIAIAETFAMLYICDAPALTFTVSLFWLANPLVLYQNRDPVICAFFARLGIRREPAQSH